MAKKYTIEEIKGIIEKEGCKLLSEVYEGNKKPLLIQCYCGEEFITTLANFKNGQKQCKKCGYKNGNEKKRLAFDYVKNYIEGEEGNGCRLLSEEHYYKTKLLVQCACGDTFEVRFNDFKQGQKQCPDCGGKIRAKNRERQMTFNCDYCGEESSMQKAVFELNKHHFCSLECYCEWRKINTPKGKDSPNYNHNKTDEEREVKRLIEGYSEWVKEVFERDNYTCQCCGQRGGNLNAHHLNGYHWDKEHRIDINNGVTLCKKCHDELHKLYGNKNNTIAQFREFLFNKYLQSNNLKFLALIENIDLTTRAF